MLFSADDSESEAGEFESVRNTFYLQLPQLNPVKAKNVLLYENIDRRKNLSMN